MIGTTTPLYIVCSPGRCVGKTLVARLLTEFCVLNGREVAAFDLADEGPQLADYLPGFTTLADISDVFGQVSFFEKLITNNKGAQIVDLSYRSFETFFTIVEQIGFFEEARRCSVESLIFFVVDASVKSRHIYPILQERFRDLPVVRVNNWSTARMTASNFVPYEGMPINSIEVPRLRLALRAQIDQQTFSFCHLWRATSTDLRDPLEAELRYWLETVLSQLRDLQSPFASAEVQMPQHDAGSVDQCGNAIVNMLQTNSEQIQAARDQIGRLKTEIEHLQNRARIWLQLVAKGMGEKR